MLNVSSYYYDHLSQVLNGKIISVIIDSNDKTQSPYLGFVVKVGNKTYEILSLRDTEGNGSGHLDIVERV